MEIHPSDETKLIINDDIINKDQSPSSSKRSSSWRPRILYAVVFTWLAFTGGRFTAPFLKNEIGGYLNNDSIIGFLLACQNISSAIAAPFFSNLADRYEQKKKRQGGGGRLFILKIALAVGSLATLLHSAPTALFGDGSSSSSSALLLLEGGNKRNKYLIISWHLVLRILYSFSFLFGITLSFLQQEQQERQHCGNTWDDDSKVDDDENESSEESSAYGKERLHGAIWWAIQNIILGKLIDMFTYKALYFTAISSTLVSFVLIDKYEKNVPRTVPASVRENLKSSSKNYNAIDTPTTQSPMIKKSPKLLQQRKNTTKETSEDNISVFQFLKIMLFTNLHRTVFLISYFLLNTGTSVVEGLIFLYFQEDLKSSNTVCGLTVEVITVIFEIPIFYYLSCSSSTSNDLSPPSSSSPTITKKEAKSIQEHCIHFFKIINEKIMNIIQNISEPRQMQQVACVAYVIRVLGYSIIPENQMFLVLFLLEPLHGITYAFSQTGSVEFASRLMPVGFEASGQGIMGIFRGLGSFLGLSVGGFIEQNYGSRIMYRGFAILITFAILILYIPQGCCSYGGGSSSSELIGDSDFGETILNENEDKEIVSSFFHDRVKEYHYNIEEEKKEDLSAERSYQIDDNKKQTRDDSSYTIIV
eukprot:CAMPEP_0178950610 /NCGR_PEP_ID=MMETSP0789-20121207/6751_1 /TAXON_ID=3005 /ORGANISM="Rhizosolenia setigera, Strain CCMP 1694" /LENGTH=643 /DNA_ID=CAMNT_0020631361 /DNA_START=26 /DNA_END=1958 /DNA_ORIENTATION=-